jgi:hypothetical protein
VFIKIYLPLGCFQGIKDTHIIVSIALIHNKQRSNLSEKWAATKWHGHKTALSTVVTQLFCGTLNIFGRGDCSSCAHQCVFVRVTVLWDKGEVDERGRTAGAHSALWFHQQSPFAAANGYAKLAGANSFCLHADGCDRGCVLVNWRFLISQLRAVCQLFNFLQHSLHQHSFYCTRWPINHIK